MIKLILILSVCFSFSIQALTITSLNIEWYGKGGTIYGTSKDEYRDGHLRDFLTNQIPKTDVFVFQEITDTERLSSVLPHHTCHTYEIKSGAHQHVSICVLDGDQAIFAVAEEVKVGRSNLRPAFSAKLANGLNIVGLHLKAGTRETDLRLEQVENLASSRIVDASLHPKALVIGDFNTFSIDRTLRERDDVDLIDSIFSLSGFTRTAHNTPTYFGYRSKIFDRVWSRGVSIKRAEVFGPCRKDSVAFPYSKHGYYGKFISDHCALQVEVELSQVTLGN
jgi:hypothetical protein